VAVRVEPRGAPSSLAAEVTRILRHVDLVLLAAVAGLIFYGLTVLGSVSQNDVQGDPDHYVVRQGVNVALGVVALVALTFVNPDSFRRLRRPLFLVTIALLASVFLIDQVIRGTRRWIDIGFFRFQPSELGKVLVILIVAGFLAERSRRIGAWRTTLGAVSVVALPALLVFFEPDFGTALIYLAVAGAALFIAGTRWSQLAALGAAGVLVAGAVLWFLPSTGFEVLRPYQVERLTGFLHPDDSPAAATYNMAQSITAVGSGGATGRGVADASQTNLNYLPEHSTDFIFSSLAEQRGFLGAALLLLLYGLVVWRGLRTISVAPSFFTAIVAAGVVVAFTVQVFVNVGMTIGIAPITGIPLPFVSYGGSSMITTLAMIGLLQAIHVRGKLDGRP
jgi:rod shape determining protein RodA